MEGAQDLDTRNMVIITINFTRHGVWFKPFTPLSSSYGENFEILKHVHYRRLSPPPLLWDMNNIYGTPKDPTNI
jgi:hypothetical protein